jgi:hypothetical protein
MEAAEAPQVVEAAETPQVMEAAGISRDMDEVEGASQEEKMRELCLPKEHFLPRDQWMSALERPKSRQAQQHERWTMLGQHL